MPRPTLNDAVRIKEQVRSFFKGTLKSNNKMYGADGSASIDKLIFRGLNIQHADAAIADFRTRHLTAVDLLNLPFDQRAGNCGEMAAIALEYAKQSHLTHLWSVVSSINNSGQNDPSGENHGFIIMGADTHPREVASINNMALAYGVSNPEETFVCDPWANIACRYIDYPEELRNRLSKWEVEDKRLYSSNTRSFQSAVTTYMPRILASNFITFPKVDELGNEVMGQAALLDLLIGDIFVLS